MDSFQTSVSTIESSLHVYKVSEEETLNGMPPYVLE